MLHFSFSYDLPFSVSPPAILRAITLRMGFERPSEIQRTALPIVLDGHNLIAQAQSGAGKTVAFSVGMLNKIDVTQNYCQAICISPTKELADQIMKKAILPLSSYMDGIRIESARQGDEAVGRSCQSHVIVGTPGKVLSWLNKGYINGQKVKILVVDEADVMISKESRKKGLGVDTLSIRGKLSPQAQILFFSATYTEEVIDFSKRIIDRAYVIKLGAKEELVLDDIKQLWVDIKNRKGGGGKLAVLQDIYKFLTIQQSIIFVNEREVADDVSRRMKAAGFSVSTLHRSITESRDEIMEAFRRGDSKVLVATNALARGVDVPAVAVVVNFDLPMQHTNHSADTETYIHRIGRTGRFGKKGTAINFVANDLDLRLLREIEREYNPPGAAAADGAGGGHAPMIQEWDVNDIEGLAALQKTEEGGDVIDDLGAGEEEEA
jgi:ATP-dependent RNA helicase DDX19/DBP5